MSATQKVQPVLTRLPKPAQPMTEVERLRAELTQAQADLQAYVARSSAEVNQQIGWYNGVIWKLGQDLAKLENPPVEEAATDGNS